MLRDKDVGRRKRCEADIRYALKVYFPDVFKQDFTASRTAMSEAIEHVAASGQDQAVAGPRGDGKSTIAMYQSFLMVLARLIRFPVIIGKNSDVAAEELDQTVKDALKENDILASDYPEVCIPVREIANGKSAKRQKYRGRSTRVIWTKYIIGVPDIDEPWSCTNLQAFKAVGWEGRIRGTKVRNVRPDLAVIDDIDDKDSVLSETQTEKRIEVIENDIAGLAGSDFTVARVMLCTIRSAIGVATVYTDRKQRSSWGGMRFKRLIEWPAHMKLWREYMTLWTNCDRATDPFRREAEAFLRANWDEMHEGAVVNNDEQFDRRIGKDGKPLEVSAVQSCFNYIVRGGPRGMSSFLCEYQNEPPDDEQDLGDHLTVAEVSKSLNGFDRGVCSRRSVVATAMIDVGKYKLHWGVGAHQRDAACQVIDYGVKRVQRANVDRDEVAIKRALRELRDELAAKVYVTLDGEPIEIALVLVDSGNWSTMVYEFCIESGVRYMPSMGLAKYRMPGMHDRSKTRRFYGYDTRLSQSVTLANFDPGYWKSRAHDGFRGETFQPDSQVDEGAEALLLPGSISLFGEDPKAHIDEATDYFAQQIVNERYRVIQSKDGMREKTGWQRLGDNHYLDVVAGILLGGSRYGVRPTINPESVKSDVERAADREARAKTAASRRAAQIAQAQTAGAGFAKGWKGRY